MRLSAFRGDPTRRNAAPRRARASVQRTFVVGSLVILIATLSTGCPIEPPEPPAYVVENGTDVPVEVRYLLDKPGFTPEKEEPLRLIARLQPGESTRFSQLAGDSDTCLDAPLAAIGPDETEIDRLEAGTCADSDIRPTWEIGARSPFDGEGA